MSTITRKYQPTYGYSVLEHDGDGEPEYTLKCPYSSHATEYLELIAHRAAEDYHSNHDGWESTWPLTFAIFDVGSKERLACFAVEREAVPEFTTREVKP